MSTICAEYKAIIFDWDGTLLDSTTAIVYAVQQAASELKLRICSEQHIRAGIGLDSKAQYTRLFVDNCNVTEAEHAMAMVNKFYDLFYQVYADNEPVLFENVIDVLTKLHNRGIALAIATGCSRTMLTMMLAKYKITDLFSLCCCAGEFRSKPDPEMLQHIMLNLAVASDATLMVGDSVYDVQAAKNAGIDVAAVTSGVAAEAQLESLHPSFILNNVVSLLDI